MSQERIEIYQIIVDGELDASWRDWLDGFEFSIERGADGCCTTRLSGPADQPALRGILIKLWDMNLDLISLKRL